MNESREAKVHLTVRASVRDMFDVAWPLGLGDHVSHDPPIDDDDPLDVRTAHISYGDNRPEHEPDLTKIWALLAHLGDKAEVWVSMSDGAIHAESFLPGRKAEIRVHSETLGGELGLRIQKAIAVLSGDAA